MGSVGDPSIGVSVRTEEELFADREAALSRSAKHSTVLFRINSMTKLRKLKKAFSAKVGARHGAVRVLLDLAIEVFWWVQGLALCPRRQKFTNGFPICRST